VTSAVIGASSVEQLDTDLDTLSGQPLNAEDPAAIDNIVGSTLQPAPG
jgi:L-glyceraldehyde 3-phosphate reductase